MTSLPTNVNDIRGDGLEHREYHAALHKLAVAPPQVLQAAANVIGCVFAGGYKGCCVLQEDTPLNRQWNVISGTLPPWDYAAGHTFALEVDAPPFTSGTLQIVYAEMDITNMAGTERIAVGLDTPLSLTTGQQIAPLVWDDAAEVAQIGTDLSMDGSGHVTTTAGGLFVVSYFVGFAPVGLAA